MRSTISYRPKLVHIEADGVTLHEGPMHLGVAANGRVWKVMEPYMSALTNG